jgi:hypothetical protein
MAFLDIQTTSVQSTPSRTTGEDHPMKSVKMQHQHTPEEERKIREAALDETLEGSFPASDPPSSNPNPDDHDAVEPEVPRQGTQPFATVRGPWFGSVLGINGWQWPHA